MLTATARLSAEIGIESFGGGAEFPNTFQVRYEIAERIVKSLPQDTLATLVASELNSDRGERGATDPLTPLKFRPQIQSLLFRHPRESSGPKESTVNPIAAAIMGAFTKEPGLVAEVRTAVVDAYAGSFQSDTLRDLEQSSQGIRCSPDLYRSFERELSTALAPVVERVFRVLCGEQRLT